MTKLTAALTALTASAMLAVSAPAVAAPFNFQPGQTSQQRSGEFRGFDEQGSYGSNQNYDQRQYANNYDDNGNGNYCRQKSGTTGMVIGGVVGGVLGHEIAGRRNRTLGTIIGAVGGGLLGRSIDRGGKNNCR